MAFDSATPPASSSEPSFTLATLGWDEHWNALFAPHHAAESEPGRVIRHDGGAVLTALDTETRQLQLRRSLPPLAVGDWVVTSGDVVVDLLPRRSLLQRLDPSTGISQPIAANIDVVMIVCALDRPLKPGRIQRLVTQATDTGALPLLVLTKADTSDDAAADTAAAQAFDPGLDVVAVAALVGDGIDQLSRHTVDRTLVVVGESGAGKSTLVNTLCGRDVAGTGAVRSGDSSGRHTTTARQMHLLPGGGRLIDTPGVRAVGLWAETDAVDQTFADIVALAADCRFRDCEHDKEPGCEVRAAVGRQDLAVQRLDSWHRLRGEAKAGRSSRRKSARH